MKRLIVLPTALLTLILSAASCQPRPNIVFSGPRRPIPTTTQVPTTPDVTRPRRTVPESVPTTQPPPPPDGTRPRRTVPGG